MHGYLFLDFWCCAFYPIAQMTTHIYCNIRLKFSEVKINKHVLYSHSKHQTTSALSLYRHWKSVVGSHTLRQGRLIFSRTAKLPCWRLNKRVTALSLLQLNSLTVFDKCFPCSNKQMSNFFYMCYILRKDVFGIRPAKNKPFRNQKTQTCCHE